MNKATTQLNLVQKALQFEDLENFVDALNLMHLTELVKAGGPFTVFAPVNLAFLHLPEQILKKIESQSSLLSTVLQYHIVPGKYYTPDLFKRSSLRSLIGADIYPVRGKGSLWINDVKLVSGDYEASNGILHMVDRVLVPNELDVKVNIKNDNRYASLCGA